MTSRMQHQQAIEQSLNRRGLVGVHVTVDETDTAWLEGQVASESEEIAAVEAAVEVDVTAVIDALDHPQQDHSPHLSERLVHLPVVTPHPKGVQGDPGLTILRGANLSDRLFDVDIDSQVRTGNPID